MIVQLAQSQYDLEKIFLLRYEVLRAPLNLSYSDSYDTLEATSYNAFIEFNNYCIACGRLQTIDNAGVGQIRYMAVHQDFRGEKLGCKILTFLEYYAKNIGLCKIKLNARENAVAFYQKANYKIIEKGDVLFGSIQHYWMEKELI